MCRQQRPICSDRHCCLLRFATLWRQLCAGALGHWVIHTWHCLCMHMMIWWPMPSRTGARKPMPFFSLQSAPERCGAKTDRRAGIRPQSPLFQPQRYCASSGAGAASQSLRSHTTVRCFIFKPACKVLIVPGFLWYCRFAPAFRIVPAQGANQDDSEGPLGGVDSGGRQLAVKRQGPATVTMGSAAQERG